MQLPERLPKQLPKQLLNHHAEEDVEAQQVVAEKWQKALDLARERKQIPPEGSGYKLWMVRQNELPVSTDGTLPQVDNPNGLTAEGFIEILTPQEKVITIDDNGTITVEQQETAVGLNIAGLPDQLRTDELTPNTAELTFSSAQNVKYIEGTVQFIVRGWKDTTEFRENVVKSIDLLIKNNTIRSIADVSALYQLRLYAAGVALSNAELSNIQIDKPDGIHAIGEEFGSVYDYAEYPDPDSDIAITAEGKKVKKTSGVWFSFQESPTKKTIVYDSFISWDGKEQPHQTAEQAVGLLLHTGKVLLNIEYCPARQAYELTAVGGAFKAGQSTEKIKDRIKRTLAAEAKEEQGIVVGEVRFLTDQDKPLLNAPDYYDQRTHLILAQIEDFGAKDFENADEVNELGLIALTFEELDALIANGTIKDPSIIAARAIMVANGIDGIEDVSNESPTATE